MMIPYRIRIMSGGGGRCYIVRAVNGVVSNMSASETPLALSNLVGNEAAELRFKLEDARDGKAALDCLHKVLTAQWAGNPTMQPKVELFSGGDAQPEELATLGEAWGIRGAK